MTGSSEPLPLLRAPLPLSDTPTGAPSPADTPRAATALPFPSLPFSTHLIPRSRAHIPYPAYPDNRTACSLPPSYLHPKAPSYPAIPPAHAKPLQQPKMPAHLPPSPTPSAPNSPYASRRPCTVQHSAQREGKRTVLVVLIEVVRRLAAALHGQRLRRHTQLLVAGEGRDSELASATVKSLSLTTIRSDRPIYFMVRNRFQALQTRTK